jgi:hypothetical protein
LPWSFGTKMILKLCGEKSSKKNEKDFGMRKAFLTIHKKPFKYQPFSVYTIVMLKVDV